MRCQCTLEKINATTWVKPKTGYLKPDPDCSACEGKGYVEINIIIGDDDADTWMGVCRICGEFNGVYFEYAEVGIGPPKDNDRPPCVNDKCINEFCDWIREIDLN